MFVGTIRLEDTRFIFQTNFSGDPNRDKYHSSERKGNIIIPDAIAARELIDQGFNVKLTKPREGEEEGFVPAYYIAIRINFDSKWPPSVYLVSGDSEPVRLDEETLGIIDNMRIQNVNVVLNPYLKEGNERPTLYVRTMYVEQSLEDDPFAARYARRRDDRTQEPEEEEENF